MNKHPHITELYKIYQSETQPFRKVHRMIDLFESIIKTHTVVIMSSYVNHNKLSDTAKGLLAQGLRTPSLGTWQLFSRELFKELESDSYNLPLASFATEFIALDTSLNAEKTNVISFRNNYAHGATPTDAQCEADIKQFEPYLQRLLASKWLAESAIEIIDHKVALQTQQSTISLHPLLLYRPEASEPLLEDNKTSIDAIHDILENERIDIEEAAQKKRDDNLSLGLSLLGLFGGASAIIDIYNFYSDASNNPYWWLPIIFIAPAAGLIVWFHKFK